MSLSAAREGVLLPGRKGNRVRLGREGGAQSPRHPRPPAWNPTLTHTPRQTPREEDYGSHSNPELFHLPAIQPGDPSSGIVNTTSSMQTWSHPFPLSPPLPVITPRGAAIPASGLQGASWLPLLSPFLSTYLTESPKSLHHVILLIPLP